MALCTSHNQFSLWMEYLNEIYVSHSYIYTFTLTLTDEKYSKIYLVVF